MTKARQLIRVLREAQKYIDLFQDEFRDEKDPTLSSTLMGFVDDLSGDAKKDAKEVKKFTGWLKANATNNDVVGKASKADVSDWINFIKEMVK